MDDENVEHIYSSILFSWKDNEMAIVAGKCLELENITRSVVTQVQNGKCHIFPLIRGSRLSTFRF